MEYHSTHPIQPAFQATAIQKEFFTFPETEILQRGGMVWENQDR